MKLINLVATFRNIKAALASCILYGMKGPYHISRCALFRLCYEYLNYQILAFPRPLGSFVMNILLQVPSSQILCNVYGPGSDKGKPSPSSLFTCHAGVLSADQHVAIPDEVA